MDESTELVIAIRRGDYDGQLDKINRAVVARTEDPEGPSMHWRFSLDGLTATEDDMTGNETARWEELAERIYVFLKPGAVMKVDFALVRTLLETRRGMSEEDAVAKASTYRTVDIAAAFSQYEVEAPVPFENPPGDED